MTFSRAQLFAGNINLIFPVNPYTANWSYQENVTSQDTIGGRVIQLLSIQVQDLTVTSVAGSRSELQKIADGVSEIMKYHVKTSLPARFKVPSRKWDFRVYLTSMPQIGWDVASTTYPYQIGMVVQEDVSGIKSAQILRNELSRLTKGIGYQEGFHGGDVKGFQKIVNSVLKAAGPYGDGTFGGDGSVSVAPNESGINPDKGHLSPEEIAKLAAWALAKEAGLGGSDLVKNTLYAIAVCLCESGGYVGSTAQGINSTAIGLWQASASQNGFSVQELLTAEGNARWMAVELKADYALAQDGNPYPLRTWDHAWYAYWGCFYQRDGEERFKSFLSVARDAVKRVL